MESIIYMQKREPTMPRLNLKVVGNHLHRCNNSSPRYTRENHYAIFVLFENFLRFQVQDKHNASYFPKCRVWHTPIQLQSYEFYLIPTVYYQQKSQKNPKLNRIK